MTYYLMGTPGVYDVTEGTVTVPFSGLIYTTDSTLKDELLGLGMVLVPDNDPDSIPDHPLITPQSIGAEPRLGNPSADGKILSSTRAGVRRWIVPPTTGEPRLGNPSRNGRLLRSTTGGTRSWVPPGEPALGNPSADGKLLSSTRAGVRSWIVPPTTGEPALGNPAADGYMLTSTRAGVRTWQQVPSIRIGSTFIPLGDSTTENYSGNGSYRVWLASQTGMRLIRNAGVGGNTSANMLARLNNDVIAYSPNICSVLAGVNDLAQGVPYATCRDNLHAIYTALLAAGILPVPLTTPSASGYLPKLNSWIRTYATAHRIPVVDLAAVVLQPDGTWPSTWTLDQTHPTIIGAKAMATACATALASLIIPGRAPLALFDNDPGNLLPHPTFTAGYDGTTPDAPLGWSKFNGTWAGQAATLITDPTDSTNVRKLWQLAFVNTSGNNAFGVDVLSAGADGDVMEFTGRINKTLVSGVENEWNIAVDLPAISGYGFYTEFLNVKTNTGDTTFQTRFTLPAGRAGHIRLYLFINAGTGSTTVTLGQWALRNLTALGAV